VILPTVPPSVKTVLVSTWQNRCACATPVGNERSGGLADLRTALHFRADDDLPLGGGTVWPPSSSAAFLTSSATLSSPADVVSRLAQPHVARPSGLRTGQIDW